MKFELRHAHVVTTIARAGSISRAAAELSLPQPSLTTQLRRIERLVGGDLFLRTRRGVVPTPLGERVIPMLAELLVASDAVLAQARGGGPTVVRFGLADWTPPTLRSTLVEGIPGHEVETVTVPASRVLDDVEQGALTVALVSGGMESGPAEVTARGLTSALVVREPVWVATSGTAPAASRLGRHLADRPWVRYTAEHPLAAADRLVRRRFGISSAQVVHRVGSQAEATAWVAEAGAGAVVTPTGPLGDVRLVDPGDAPLVAHHLVHRPEALPADVAQDLLAVLRRHHATRARRRPAVWRWLVEHQAHDSELADLVVELGADLRVELSENGSQAQSSRAATRSPISSPTTSPASLLAE